MPIPVPPHSLLSRRGRLSEPCHFGRQHSRRTFLKTWQPVTLPAAKPSVLTLGFYRLFGYGPPTSLRFAPFRQGAPGRSAFAVVQTTHGGSALAGQRPCRSASVRRLAWDLRYGKILPEPLLGNGKVWSRGRSVEVNFHTGNLSATILPCRRHLDFRGRWRSEAVAAKLRARCLQRVGH